MLEVVTFKRAPVANVQVRPTSAEVQPRFPTDFIVVVMPPANAAPAAYERMLLFTINGTTYVVPISYAVRQSVSVNSDFALTNRPSDWWYNASELRGRNNWAWRYEAGDWRVYYISTPTLARGLYIDFSWRCANISLILYTITDGGFFAGYFWNQGVTYHQYIGSGKFYWTGVGGATRLIAVPSASFAVPISVAGYAYTTMSASYPVSNVRSFTVVVRSSLYGGCSTSEAVSGRVRPFIEGDDAPVSRISSPFARATLSRPPLDYLFAVKFATVMGGGFVVPMFTVGTDLRFNMLYIRTPVFVDYVALLYAPQYAVWYRTGGNNFGKYPWYAVEGVSVIG